MSDTKTDGPESDLRHRGLFLSVFSLFSSRRNNLQKFIFIIRVSHLITTCFDHIIYIKAFVRLFFLIIPSWGLSPSGPLVSVPDTKGLTIMKIKYVLNGQLGKIQLVVGPLRGGRVEPP